MRNYCQKRPSGASLHTLSKAKSRKYRGVFKVEGQEKTRQVQENWSQQLEHKQSKKRDDTSRWFCILPSLRQYIALFVVAKRVAVT